MLATIFAFRSITEDVKVEQKTYTVEDPHIRDNQRQSILQLTI